MSGIAQTQVQRLALGLAEPHVVHVRPVLQPLQVPLDDTPSFWCTNHTTQLGGIYELAQGALNPIIYVIDEDTEKYLSQERPLRYLLSLASLGTAIEPIILPSINTAHRFTLTTFLGASFLESH